MPRQDRLLARPRFRFGLATILSLVVTTFAMGASGIAAASQTNASVTGASLTGASVANAYVTRTSVRDATPAVSLSGAEWLMYWHWKNDQKKGPCAEDFRKNGAFVDCDGTSGTWSQSGNEVKLRYPSCHETWTATYDKPFHKFVGTMQSGSCGETGNFYLDKVGSITSVAFSGAASGSGSPPTLTVEGSDFGTEPASEPAACGGSGLDFTNDNFYLTNESAEWNAGAPGNCVGLVVQTFTGSEVAFSFGDNYDVAPDYDILNGGNKLSLDINGQTVVAFVTYPSAGTDPSQGPES